MGHDYREHLSNSALRLLGQATGVPAGVDPALFFQERPHDISVALATPGAEHLLAELLREPAESAQPAVLSIAIAVHRTAQEICQAGWSFNDTSPVDLALVRFAGQSECQRFTVELLRSFVRHQIVVDTDEEPATQHGVASVERLHGLIHLANEVGDFERTGALRLLGDEALFAVSMCPRAALDQPVDPHLLARLRTVLPRAMSRVIDEMTPNLRTVLDLYLHFGPIWYRMSATSLLHAPNRDMLRIAAADFATARRFVVRVAQGHLAPYNESLFVDIA